MSKTFSLDIASFEAGQATLPGADLLGLHWKNKGDAYTAIDKGLTPATYKRLLRHCYMGESNLPGLIMISPRTIRKRIEKKERFKPVESERIYRIARILSLATDLFEGDNKKAKQWLTKELPGLNGNRPIDICKTDIGARDVEDLIFNLEHGNFV